MARVVYNVPLIPQSTDVTCWYAAAQMIVRFYRERRQRSSIAGYSIDQPELTQAVNQVATSIEPAVVQRFARAQHLRMEFLCPTISGLLELLSSYGPLWYGGTAEGYRGYRGAAHVVVITGCIDDDFGTEVLINDPWPPNQGASLSFTYSEFFGLLASQDSRVPILHI